MAIYWYIPVYIYRAILQCLTRWMKNLLHYCVIKSIITYSEVIQVWIKNGGFLSTSELIFVVLNPEIYPNCKYMYFKVFFVCLFVCSYNSFVCKYNGDSMVWQVIPFSLHRNHWCLPKKRKEKKRGRWMYSNLIKCAKNKMQC